MGSVGRRVSYAKVSEESAKLNGGSKPPSPKN